MVKGEVDKGNPTCRVSDGATAGPSSFKEKALGGALMASSNLKQILHSDLSYVNQCGALA